jgi:hypothetical protein
VVAHLICVKLRAKQCSVNDASGYFRHLRKEQSHNAILLHQNNHHELRVLRPDQIAFSLHGAITIRNYLRQSEQVLHRLECVFQCCMQT